METQNLKSQIESLLFISAKPLKSKDLAKILETDENTIKEAVDELAKERLVAGVIVLQNKDEFQLATNPANSALIKNFQTLELREKLTDATVEVLAIVAYRQPISKAELEAIRGVNSQYSLRTLLMRGLIEKVSNPSDGRSFLYQTTTEFLMHLGLNSNRQLPEFEKLAENIKLPQTAQTADENEQAAPANPPPAEAD